MKEKQVWEHINRKYKDGKEKSTFLYEVFYNRNRLISPETYSTICDVLNTPICTGVIFGQLANQIAERTQKERKEREKLTLERKQEDLENAKRFLDSLRGRFGKGQIERTPFCATYIKEKILMVSMLEDGSLLERLVEAFSEAVKYNPFCKYTDLGGMKTYEWDKRNPDKRYAALRREGKEDLIRLDR
ncbi:MAG: hypothetical protein AABX07_03410 [Nanoarchaeota archaeon]